MRDANPWVDGRAGHDQQSRLTAAGLPLPRALGWSNSVPDSDRKREVSLMIQREAAVSRVMLLPLLSCLASCARDTAPAVVVRDSAGIAIRTSPPGMFPRLPSWRLSEPPRVEIGSLEGDPGHQLNQVTSASLLPDDVIFVGDGGSRELRLFDTDGRTLHIFGGKGQGPGELPFLRAATVLPGDTIVASAWPFGLLSRFGPDGSFLESTRLGPFWPGLVAEILTDGSLLLDLFDRGYGNNVEGWAASGTEPLFRPRGWLVRVFEDGRQDTLREVDGQQWFKHGKFRQDLWLGPLPFGPTTAVTVGGSRVYVGDTGRAEIQALSIGGELEGLVRWDEAAVPVTRADREAVGKTALESLRQPARRPHLERWLGEVPYPEHKPAFTALFTDRAGRAWVRLPTSVGSPTDRWIVFDLDGHPLARLEPTAGSRFLDAGEDFAILVWKNELELEFVRLYDLDK